MNCSYILGRLFPYDRKLVLMIKGRKLSAVERNVCDKDDDRSWAVYRVKTL